MTLSLDLVDLDTKVYGLQMVRMIKALSDSFLHPAASLPGHEDARRRIVDLDDQVKIYEVKGEPGLRLGNHYHRVMDEWYFAVSGEFAWTLADLENGRRREITQKEGQIIYVPRKVAHLVVPSPNSIFMGYVEPVFNKDDFVPYKL